nr:MAG TPA: hypothetical protein [Caudoviricetes sp.]DAH97729.1 MAG TPA: hypothetical protein [Caudoviricetes sp.]DAN87420.1 MAG TPA: hypothetical protein [Caudoviricetes sp.]
MRSRSAMTLAIIVPDDINFEFIIFLDNLLLY